MHSADVSLIYPFMVLITLIFKNYILAYKIGSAILAGLYSISVFVFAKYVSKSIYISILLASYTFFSPTLTYIAAQFPKNLLGVIFLNFFLLSIAINKNILKAVFFILTFLTHRMTAGLSVIILSFDIFVETLHAKSLQKKWFLILAAVIASVIFISILSPGIIHISDLKRFEGIFTFIPQIAPVSFLKLMELDRVGILWCIEIFTLYLLLIILIFLCIINKSFFRHLFNGGGGLWIKGGLLVCIILVFPFYKMELTGIGFRFFLVFYLIMPLLIIPFLKMENGKWKMINGKKTNLISLFSRLGCELCMSDKVRILFTICLLSASFFSVQEYDPKKYDPPYSLYKKIAIKTQQVLKLNDPELIIAHKSLAEMITFTTSIDALAWQPEYEIEENKLWRITYGIKNHEFKKYLNKDEFKYLKRISLNYNLIREDCWQKFIKKVAIVNDIEVLNKIYSWENPYKKRPGYLLRN